MVAFGDRYDTRLYSDASPISEQHGISTARDPAGPQVRKEFTARPGETLDLGEIRIEKPQTLAR